MQHGDTAKRQTSADAVLVGQEKRARNVKCCPDVNTDRAQSHWNANATRDGPESCAKFLFAQPIVIRSMGIARNQESVVAKLDGSAMTVPSVIHIQDARMVTVPGHGNAIASTATVECCAMKN